jgi:hypothetical protein
MLMNRLAMLLAAGACALLAALWWFAARRGDPDPRATRTEPVAAGCDCTHSAAGGGAATAAADTEPPHPPQLAASTTMAARFAVCEREETRAALARVPLLAARSELWTLHCGRSLHLIALEELGDTLVPQRVAIVQNSNAGPGEAAVAAPAGAADVNGDGRVDWIAPVLLADGSGVPRGGGVYVLQQRATGGFEPPVRLLAAAPGSVVAAELDARPGQDLALLHRQDASIGLPDELWLIAGGPSPLRIAQRPASVSTAALAALDLDLDGRDDVIAASGHEGRIRIWLSRRGALAQVEPIDVAIKGVQQLLVVDIDGDAQRELLLVGERAWLLAAKADALPEAVAIDDSEDLRDLHFADANGDGRADLVGYAHPDLIALLRTEARFERRRVLSLRGEASILFARIAQLDRDPRPDLLMAVLAADDKQVELAIARNLAPGATVQLAAAANPISEAALLQRFAIP